MTPSCSLRLATSVVAPWCVKTNTSVRMNSVDLIRNAYGCTLCEKKMLKQTDSEMDHFASPESGPLSIFYRKCAPNGVHPREKLSGMKNLKAKQRHIHVGPLGTETLSQRMDTLATTTLAANPSISKLSFGSKPPQFILANFSATLKLRGGRDGQKNII